MRRRWQFRLRELFLAPLCVAGVVCALSGNGEGFAVFVYILIWIVTYGAANPARGNPRGKDRR